MTAAQRLPRLSDEVRAAAWRSLWVKLLGEPKDEDPRTDATPSQQASSVPGKRGQA